MTQKKKFTKILLISIKVGRGGGASANVDKKFLSVNIINFGQSG